MTHRPLRLFASSLLAGPFLLIGCFLAGCENTETRLGSEPGASSQAAPTGPSDILRLTDDDFDRRIAEGIVLVDFYADWCGPCKAMEPHLEAFATDMKDQMVTAKINVDHSQKTARKYGITSMPTLIVFVDGKPVKTRMGAFRDKAAIRNFVADVLIEHGGTKKEDN